MNFPSVRPSFTLHSTPHTRLSPLSLTHRYSPPSPFRPQKTVSLCPPPTPPPPPCPSLQTGEWVALEKPAQLHTSTTSTCTSFPDHKMPGSSPSHPSIDPASGNGGRGAGPQPAAGKDETGAAHRHGGTEVRVERPAAKPSDGRVAARTFPTTPGPHEECK